MQKFFVSLHLSKKEKEICDGFIPARQGLERVGFFQHGHRVFKTATGKQIHRFQHESGSIMWAQLLYDRQDRQRIFPKTFAHSQKAQVAEYKDVVGTKKILMWN